MGGHVFLQLPYHVWRALQFSLKSPRSHNSFPIFLSFSVCFHLRQNCRLCDCWAIFVICFIMKLDFLQWRFKLKTHGRVVKEFCLCSVSFLATAQLIRNDHYVEASRLLVFLLVGILPLSMTTSWSSRDSTKVEQLEVLPLLVVGS